ncbi:MAG: RNA methyltransferase, partial [Bryobacteraceae bacterium]
FGCTRLRLANCFAPNFREARSAVGAPDLLKNAEEFRSVAEAIADCSLVIGTTGEAARRPEQPLHLLSEAGPILRARLATERAALLFGSEKRGLSNDDLSYCRWLLRVPTRDEHPSMNLGKAIAVCLYELIRSEAPARTPREQREPPASAAALDRLTRTLLDGLAESGYIKAGTESASEEKSRRLIRRMNLNEKDAETWTGMLAKIRNRIG